MEASDKPPTAVVDGEVWYDTSLGVFKVWSERDGWLRIAEGKSLRETAAEAEASGVEFTRMVLRPHHARLRSGAWWCARCGGESCDPEILREVGCVE